MEILKEILVGVSRPKETLPFIAMMVRAVITWLALLIYVIFMGKREVGQLSPLDFIVGMTIANFIFMPVVDPRYSVIVALGATVIFKLLGDGLTQLAFRYKLFRKILSGTPVPVIQGGKILEENLIKSRYHLHYLLSEMRNAGYANLNEIEYAILEPTGKLSVFTKADRRPVKPMDMGLKPPYEGPPITIIEYGKIVRESLSQAGKDVQWLMGQLQANSISSEKEVLLAQLDSQGMLYIDRYETPVH